MRKKYFINVSIFISFILLLLLVSNCAINDATGERQLVILSEEEENNIGAREHPNIVKSFSGIYQNKKLQNYIKKIGTKIVLNSEIANIRWTFTILDSPIVNAFALPGGYVYVTRGLLSLANDEAEIASVLAHEIAHVTAKHSAQRHAKATLSEIGLNILSVVVGQPLVTNIANIGVQGVLSAFSRSEELEADQLSIGYIIKSKYDPNGSVRFLKRLDALTNILSKTEQNSINSLFSTHPKTMDRIIKSKNSIPKNIEYKSFKKEYLAAINNMIYGDNSSHGIIKGNKFFHTELNFSFTVPNNYKIINNDNSVISFNEDKSSIVIFDGLYNDENLTLLEIAESNYVRSNIDSHKELFIDKNLAIVFKEKNPVVFEGEKYLRSTYLINWTNNRIWRFSLLVNPLKKKKYVEELNNIATSIHYLSEEEKIEGRPNYIQIIETKSGDTPNKLSKAMAITENKLEIFSIINGLDKMNSNEVLSEGILVKIIVN